MVFRDVAVSICNNTKKLKLSTWFCLKNEEICNNTKKLKQGIIISDRTIISKCNNTKKLKHKIGVSVKKMIIKVTTQRN